MKNIFLALTTLLTLNTFSAPLRDYIVGGGLSPFTSCDKLANSFNVLQDEIKEDEIILHFENLKATCTKDESFTMGIVEFNIHAAEKLEWDYGVSKFLPLFGKLRFNLLREFGEPRQQDENHYVYDSGMGEVTFTLENGRVAQVKIDFSLWMKQNLYRVVSLKDFIEKNGRDFSMAEDRTYSKVEDWEYGCQVFVETYNAQILGEKRLFHTFDFRYPMNFENVGTAGIKGTSSEKAFIKSPKRFYEPGSYTIEYYTLNKDIRQTIKQKFQELNKHCQF